MNTVLDDNKKLCLTSGEIISLTPFMRIQFEVEDLSVASPATVSRCGMVFMEPTALGMSPLIQVFPNTLPDLIPLPDRERITKLLILFHAPLIRCIRKKCTEPSNTMDNSIIFHFARLFHTFMNEYKVTEARTPSEEELGAFATQHLSNIFLFCCVWGMGGSINAQTRPQFSEEVWKLVNNMQASEDKDLLQGLNYPKDKSWFDFCYNPEEGDWKLWRQTVPEFKIPARKTYDSIIVPTTDSIRMMFVASRLVENLRPINKHKMCPS